MVSFAGAGMAVAAAIVVFAMCIMAQCMQMLWTMCTPCRYCCRCWSRMLSSGSEDAEWDTEALSCSFSCCDSA